MEKPMITITYCVPCDYLPRALWQAGELLRPLAESVAGLTLVPGTGGVYDVALGDTVLFSKAEQGRFPEVDELVKAAFAELG
jgi:selenoprotein W-related protein